MEITIFDERKNRSLKFSLNSGIIITIFIAAGAILILFIYGILNFTSEGVDRIKLKELNDENRVLQEEITRIRDNIQVLNLLLDSLEKNNLKLKSFAPLEPLEKVITPRSDTTDSVILTPQKDISQLSDELDGLLFWAQRYSESFKELLKHLEKNGALKNHIPSIAPVRGWFYRGFGYKIDPFTEATKMHEGIDIVAPVGTPIIAPADGVVKSVELKSGFGLSITIDHNYGYSTFYAHCHQAIVLPGQNVKRGEIIGFVGNTGKSTGPHLHYEVRIGGVPVDPLNYILTSK